MTARVSVIVPCHNAAPYIGETLESLARQTWPHLEIIVVDDGSTDASARIVEGFSKDITLLRQANQGQPAALNAGLRHATGHFVQYLDADDLIDPDKIEVQVRRLLENPGSVATARWGRFYGHPEKTQFETESVSRDLNSVDWLVMSRSAGLGMLFPALWLVPMPLVRSVGPWREELSLGNDTEYFTRVVLASGSVLFCPDARCRYRSGVPGSLSGKKTPKHWRSAVSVLDLCESHLRTREDSERVRRAFALSWQHLAHAAYPYAPEIAQAALARARALHSETIHPDGGPTFKLVCRLIGWRAARHLQVASGRP